MAAIRATTVIAIFLLAAAGWRTASSTCVLDSDFGFTLNCQFRKSSMFRVRNLGGVKGYVGLGFSVGDELGFRQSLSNLEGNKRRSTVGRSTGLTAVPDDTKVGKSGEAARQYMGTASRSTQLTSVPPFRPIPADNMTPLRPVGPGVVAVQMNDTVRRYNAATVPQFLSLPASITRAGGNTASKAPQVFKNALQQATDNFQTNLAASKLSHRAPTYLHQGPQVVQVVAASDRSSSVLTKPLPTAIPVANALPQGTEKTKAKPEPSTSLMADTVKSLSAASNLSEDTIVAAIALKQQQLLQQQQQQMKVSTTSTTARPLTEPPRKYPLSGPSRVMNAPREYYPVGYDKNFDDNFVSRVELPDTAFYCGEQKHFPGLYADEDLGCMVFHVCAFTDDGLIMKSFLCPESTLFDQSILKCNWWFYVDCKASRKLYDSNIPVSKSYQLMKALSFFSAYNKQR